MWPEKVIRQFSTLPQNPEEGDFLGPYNKLLYTLFPPDTDFTVDPKPLPDPRDPGNLIAVFEVLLVNKPVFSLALKPPSHLNFISDREAADHAIRLRMIDLAHTCPIDTLHAVSAFGTKLAFYSLETGNIHAQITPHTIPRDHTLANDTVPVDRWNYDILEAEGEARFRAVVHGIKEKCARLSETLNLVAL